ncbi:hypothetical protein HYZ97_00695 [Candidatus Pacearchaeota archaeon]|nr:hypothetical protein [Candidatus Pacearchaeota archaeon]
MRKWLSTDKRGVTEMLSYVLLVIIAVGLSALVFNYLSVYVPKNKLQCSDDIALALQSYTCTYAQNGQTSLSIVLVNKGLFTVDAAYIRISKEGRRVGTLLNNPEEEEGQGHCSFFLSDDCTNPNAQGLPPAKQFSRSYFVPADIIDSPGEYKIEIQPAAYTNDELALCSNAVIIQPITCT